MSRLIKDDDAVERISNAIWHLPNDMYPRFNNFDTIHAVVKDAVKGVPTVEPRAKGEWRMVYHNDYRTVGHIECDQCGYRTKGHMKYNFCPNCGADMRQEEEQ